MGHYASEMGMYDNVDYSETKRMIAELEAQREGRKAVYKLEVLRLARRTTLPSIDLALLVKIRMQPDTAEILQAIRELVVDGQLDLDRDRMIVPGPRFTE